jgi:hypothetical protein
VIGTLLIAALVGLVLIVAVAGVVLLLVKLGVIAKYAFKEEKPDRSSYELDQSQDVGEM